MIYSIYWDEYQLQRFETSWFDVDVLGCDIPFLSGEIQWGKHGVAQLSFTSQSLNVSVHLMYW